MSLVGNIVWLIFGGLISGLLYIFSGFLMCLTIIGIPFGLQTMKLGVATFMPFGKQVYTSPDADSPLRIILNIIWLVLFGWEIALNHLFWALVLGITIIGIPFALQHIKLVPLSLLPFGRTLAPARGG
jgi:uncharacterized membrane protein YccF (DUF307 family)